MFICDDNKSGLRCCTIREIISWISTNECVLPDIQREFVWKDYQITQLFDSLLKGYPFGTLLFWKVEKNFRGTERQVRYYAFQHDYHEENHDIKDAISTPLDKEFYAVLDGQQRLTALNIGLRGSYAAYQRWARKNPYPVKKLYFNLFSCVYKETDPGFEDNADSNYEFSLFESAECEKRNDPSVGEMWLWVGEILDYQGEAEFLNVISQKVLDCYGSCENINTLKERALSNAALLYECINKKEKIVFFEERTREFSRVLDIFIRLNDGGTKLSGSDLMFSTVVHYWHGNAKDEFNAVKTRLSKFNINKDFIIKAGLVLSDARNIRFNINNFTKINIEKIEAHWENIKISLEQTVDLFGKFGLSTENFWQYDLMLPVAYYINHLGAPDDFTSSYRFKEDRNVIKNWVYRAIIKGIFSGRSESLLIKIRGVIRDSSSGKFPETEIEEQVLKPMNCCLKFNESEVDYLLDLGWTHNRSKIFAILSLILMGTDNDIYHLDHIYPRSMFQRLPESNDDAVLFAKQNYDRLPNLQLLTQGENTSKGKTPPKKWINSEYKNTEERDNFCLKEIIDYANIGDDIKSFRSFYEYRRNKLRERIVSRIIQEQNII